MSAARPASKRRRAVLGVEVSKGDEPGYRLSAPDREETSWRALVREALGTKSNAIAQTLLYQLSELCTLNWHPPEAEGRYGEWCPDEQELTLILNMVAGTKPRNEMEAAQAAQMIAVHLMTMRLSARALRNGVIILEDATLAGKLARTFTMQAESLAKLKGKRTSSKQTIIVKQERHDHRHQHVHVEGGGRAGANQSDAAEEVTRAGAKREHTPVVEGRASLPGPEEAGRVVPFASGPGEACLPNARRAGGRTQG